MNFDFEQTMKQASDEELIRIVITNRDEYQEAAIAAAEKELRLRNLPKQQLAMHTNKQQWLNERKAMKAAVPLELHWKILSFLFPGVIQLIIAGSFKANGYDQKANEIGKWTIYGVLFYLGITIYGALS